MHNLLKNGNTDIGNWLFFSVIWYIFLNRRWQLELGHDGLQFEDNDFKCIILKETYAVCVNFPDWLSYVSVGISNGLTLHRHQAVIWTTADHIYWGIYARAYSGLVPSQWETSLHSNAVSHWPGAYLESALMRQQTSMIHTDCAVMLDSAWWLLMAWSLFDARISATIIT